jgi:hypothetical protein
MNAENSFKGSPQLQEKIADADMTRYLLAHYLKARKSDAVKLLNLNGVNIDNLASLKTVTTAFLKAIYASDSFRRQASQAMSDYALTLKKKSFSGRKYHNATDEYGNYYDDGSDPLSGLGYYNSETTSTAPSTTTSGSSSGTSSSSSSSSGGSFWDTLGGIFSKDVIQTGIKTGLGALSTSISSNANNTSQQNALAIEQAKLAQIQAAAGLKNSSGGGANGGLSTGWKIAIGVGVLAIITTMIILVVRKK